MGKEAVREAEEAQVERRVQAVLALWRGASIRQVSHDSGISRSILWKLQRRARQALRLALRDRPRGPRRPGNRLGMIRRVAVHDPCSRPVGLGRC